MLKVVIGILVVGALGLGVAYYLGGIGSFDPTAEGNNAKAAITAGMTWQQVLGVAGEPSKFATHQLEKKKVLGATVESIVATTGMKFERPLFEQMLKTTRLEHGFRLLYIFSAQCSFAVLFDQDGKVEGVIDQATIADLLDTRNK